ncbi:hypothetical protein K474DRAFT_633601 [Panus rudis PR-1116 ss-1]|nr:hypothetical protein K474DRAFT_633601 [Panus rudis PR-1116 ss-1]
MQTLWDPWTPQRYNECYSMFLFLVLHATEEAQRMNADAIRFALSRYGHAPMQGNVDDDTVNLHVTLLKELKLKHQYLLPLELYATIGEPISGYPSTFVSPASGMPPPSGAWATPYGMPGYAPEFPAPWVPGMGNAPPPAPFYGTPYLQTAPLPGYVPHSSTNPTPMPFTTPSEHPSSQLHPDPTPLRSTATVIPEAPPASDIIVHPFLRVFDDSVNPLLRWNMHFRPDNSQLSIVDNAEDLSLSGGLAEPATSPALPFMELISPLLPSSITVHPSQGSNVVTCGDILTEIHKYMCKPVPRSLYDQQDSDTRKALSHAYYHNRRSTDPNVPGATMEPGLRWIDWLDSRTFFGGIVYKGILGDPPSNTFELRCISLEQINTVNGEDSSEPHEPTGIGSTNPAAASVVDESSGTSPPQEGGVSTQPDDPALPSLPLVRRSPSSASGSLKPDLSTNTLGMLIAPDGQRADRSHSRLDRITDDWDKGRADDARAHSDAGFNAPVFLPQPSATSSQLPATSTSRSDSELLLPSTSIEASDDQASFSSYETRRSLPTPRP